LLFDGWLVLYRRFCLGFIANFCLGFIANFAGASSPIWFLVFFLVFGHRGLSLVYVY
jgi:hypothetical protein